MKNAVGLPEISVTREVVVQAGIQEVFDFVAAEDVLPVVLTGYGLVPAVVSIIRQHRTMDQPRIKPSCASGRRQHSP